MTPDPSSPPPDRVPTRPRILKLPRKWVLALGGALTVLCLAAVACGGGDSGGTAQTQTADSEAVAAEPAPSSDFMATRPGAGIAAAGGNPQAIRGNNPASSPEGPNPSPLPTWAANLADLDAVGLEAIVVEEPGLIIDAYVTEVNFNGGINGRCVEFVNHLWSLADPAGSLTQICTDLATQQPVVHITLRINESDPPMRNDRGAAPHHRPLRLHPVSDPWTRPAIGSTSTTARSSACCRPAGRRALVGRDQRQRSRRAAAWHLRHGGVRSDHRTLRIRQCAGRACARGVQRPPVAA